MKKQLLALAFLLPLMFWINCSSATGANLEVTPTQDLIVGEWLGTWRMSAYAGSATVSISQGPGNNQPAAFFTLYETGTGGGTKQFQVHGSIEGERLVFRSPGSITRLALYQSSDGKSILKGDYELLSGRFSGEKGQYEFEKKGK